ncbi:acyl-CoA thioesterase [Leptospira barantonii]|uniref:Acyl-CoA thioesterase n=1 Tax=Leptospira barantonii TaxID=2023184 RepID=A0A5F2AXU8_9LEPT|nr:thioesterase family protein [Leptospira barantonii]TGL92943.1 acyl-CoA thioesterase [Leptospira barantonii]
MVSKISREEFEFSHTLRVRYAESDPQGIVFNANYLVYFDVAITEYFRAHGLPYGESVSAHEIDFHVVHTSIDYKAQAHFDEKLDIFVKGSYSGVKITWKIAIFREKVLICSGILIYAAVDTKTGNLKRIDSHLAGILKLEHKSDRVWD